MTSSGSTLCRRGGLLQKTQIQALDRTAPILPLRPGAGEKQLTTTRNGTTALFAALEVATGLVTYNGYQQHTNVEFLAFLNQSCRWSNMTVSTAPRWCRLCGRFLRWMAR